MLVTWPWHNMYIRRWETPCQAMNVSEDESLYPRDEEQRSFILVTGANRQALLILKLAVAKKE